MKNLIYLFVALLVVACGDTKPSESASDDLEKLKSEVMAIHDEVMPKMGTIRKLEKGLRAKAADAENGAELTQMADELKTANDAMMNWMRGYNPKFEGTDAEYKKYLEDEKVKISKVRDQMLSAIASGEQMAQ